ncbi:PAS domain S-box protein [Microbacteriaceae bacterium]|nr:PAS domain S-box protein [Candidatus Saccharibacteria bacterium]
MEWGGKNVNQRTAQIIRLSGFILPVILAIYGYFVQVHALPNTNSVNNLVLYLICIPWIIFGTVQYFIRSKTAFISLVRLTLYHIFAVLYLLLISGFSMPFISGWMVLFLASFAYFSLDGFRLSVLVFFAAGVSDILMHLDDQEHIMQNLIALSATLIVGYIAVMISQSQVIDKRALDKSHAKEELARDRILTIVNNLADAILSTDKDGVIQIYNAASLNLLDTNTGLNGKSIDSVVKLFDKDNVPVKLRRALKTTKGVVSRDDIQATISGETIRLSLVYSPIRSTNSSNDIESDGYVIILRDITKQKSLEEERDEFISVVSHELRTPITIAEGTLSNVQLMMSRADIPKTTLQESVTMAHDQVVFLARMVNDLSTLSRAERGVADTTETIDVAELIHDLYNEYAPQAEEKGLQFNLDLIPQAGSVEASRLYLKELLQNFVTNAIKYTKEGSVTVRVQKKGDKLIFVVKDTGIGISKSDQAHIFEKFYRSEDYRTRETGGTGLGLYVAVKLSKKLNTQITMTSRLNHGSMFEFTLPSQKTDS